MTMVPPWAVESPKRAAGVPPTMTVADPFTIESGGPTQVHMQPTFAAGMPPISTVGAPGGRIGPPTCGTGPVVIGHVLWIRQIYLKDGPFFHREEQRRMYDWRVILMLDHSGSIYVHRRIHAVAYGKNGLEVPDIWRPGDASDIACGTHKKPRRPAYL